VKGLLRAVNRSMKETLADPDAAIELLARIEPLIKKDIEKRRLLYVYHSLMDTRETREFGLGDVSDTKLASAIAAVVASFELPRSPSAGEVFDRQFLPPKADRVPPTVTP
jgi:NitT/TauT family transport system substrate-binding protein